MSNNCERIVLIIEHNPWPQRSQCTICGNITDKEDFTCRAQNPHSGVVCRACLHSGDIDRLLEDQAESLERQAQRVRQLIGRLQVPNYTEWLTAERQLAYDYGWYEHETEMAELASVNPPDNLPRVSAEEEFAAIS
jgi:hypothetical protein